MLGRNVYMNFLYDSVSDFITSLYWSDDHGYLLLISAGLLLLNFIVALVRTNFTYEMKLLRTVTKLNRYFTREPYVNDENLIRFNKKMKKVPRTLRYTWQEFMLNRDKAPSEYMNTTTCIDQPSKASSYANTTSGVATFTIIIAMLSFLFSVVYYENFVDETILSLATYFFDFFLVPVLVAVLGFLFVIFMRARYTSVNSDLYYSFHEFERNINKACTTLPQFIDYEVLFTKKEIREGIPVLQEYLEKRALQEKIEQEEAQLSSLEYEQFDFEELGVENSLLLERALLESEKYFKVKTDLYTKQKSKETEMDTYQKGFDEVTKDYERKAQVLRETLQQLTEQINNTTIKIEANYMKKRYNEEQQRLQQLEKEYELSTNRFQKQQAELQQEIDSYKEEIARRKENMEEAMKAEGRTYAKKVYSIITADVQEQSRPYLEQMEITKSELEQSVNNLKHELQYKNTELLSLSEKLGKLKDEYDIKMVGLQNIKELKEYLVSAEYREKLLTAKEGVDLEKDARKHAEKINKLEEEIKQQEEELKVTKSAKEELEKRVKELNSANSKLTSEVAKLEKKLKRKPQPKVSEENEEDDEDDDADGMKPKPRKKKKKSKKEKDSKPEEEALEEEESEKPAKKKGFFGGLFGKKEEEKPEEVEEPDKVEQLTKEIEGELQQLQEIAPLDAEIKVPDATVEPLNLDLLKDDEEEKPKKQKKNLNDVMKRLDKKSKSKKSEEEKPETVEEDAPAPESAPEKEESPEKPEKENKSNKENKTKKEDQSKPKEQPQPEKPAEKLQEKEEEKVDVSKPKRKRTGKVDKVIAKGKKSRLDKQEIEELNAIKQRIEAESKNLEKSKSDYKNTIEESISTLEADTKKQDAKSEEKPKAPTAKSKIGSSLNNLLESVEEMERKNKKDVK